MLPLKIFLYFLYLVSAELALFIILTIRNLEADNMNKLLFWVFIISIIINVFIFSFIYFRIKNYKKSNSYTKKFDINKVEDTTKQNLSDFFSFFLLPFFTFNLSNYDENLYSGLEMFFLFALLTVFLMRTNNLTANVLIYALFSKYEANVPGKKLIILTNQTKDNFENSSSSLIKIISNIYIYPPEDNKLENYILCLLCFLILLMTFPIYFYLNH